MKLLYALLLLVGLALLALGGEGLYQIARNRQQAVLTCADLQQQLPRERWLRVATCEIDYMHAGYDEAGGQVREIYFPVRPTGQALTTPAALVAATRDPEVLALVQRNLVADAPPDQEAFLVMMLKVVTMLKASREVEGYTRSGIVSRLNAKRSLAGLTSPLAPAYVVLDLHARPDPTWPAVEIASGLTFVLFCLVLTIRSRRARREPAPAPVAEPTDDAAVAVTEPVDQLDSDETTILTPTAAASLRPHDLTSPEPIASLAMDADEAPAIEAAEVTEALAEFDAPAVEPVVAQTLEIDLEAAERPVLPAMLLLNLDLTAGIDAIEQAPPLGPRAEVIARCRDACDGLLDADDGRWRSDGPRHCLIIDIGAHDPVWTATVRAQGADADDVVRALAMRTGWRLFIPKKGVFLAAHVEGVAS